jgi:drug/metabolite transporter (DMT)-like permease
MSIQAIPFILLLGLFWGSSLVASRFGVGQFHPTIFAGLRMVLASLAYFLVYLIGGRKRSFPRGSRLWRYAALFGIIGTAVPMTSIVSAMQYQSAAVTSILLTAGPVITVILAHFFLSDESLTRRKGAGVVVALGGALLLALRGESGLADAGKANPLGYILVLVGLLSAGGASIYARKFMQGLDTFDVASIRMLAAAATVMPLSALSVGIDLQQVNSQGYLALTYSAVVGTFLAMGLSFYIIQRFGVTASAMGLYVTPVVSGLGGVLILDEQITAGMVIGMAFIAVGIALINQKETER